MDVGCSRAWAGGFPSRTTQRLARDQYRPARVLGVAEAFEGVIGPAEREALPRDERSPLAAIGAQHEHQSLSLARITPELSCKGTS